MQWRKNKAGKWNLTINLKGDGINLGILEGDGSYTDDMEWNATTKNQNLIAGFLKKIKDARKVAAINATDAEGNTYIFNIGLRKMDFNVTGDGTYTDDMEWNATTNKKNLIEEIGRASCRERVSSPV